MPARRTAVELRLCHREEATQLPLTCEELSGEVTGVKRLERFWLERRVGQGAMKRLPGELKKADAGPVRVHREIGLRCAENEDGSSHAAFACQRCSNLGQTIKQRFGFFDGAGGVRAVPPGVGRALKLLSDHCRRAQHSNRRAHAQRAAYFARSSRFTHTLLSQRLERRNVSDAGKGRGQLSKRSDGFICSFSRLFVAHEPAEREVDTIFDEVDANGMSHGFGGESGMRSTG